MVGHSLIALRQAANDACEAARNADPRLVDAVNWGDLSCVRAESCDGDDGSLIYRVWISEADPDAGIFQSFVSEYLSEAGYSNITVSTEW
jgi:hypothetical protein